MKSPFNKPPKQEVFHLKEKFNFTKQETYNQDLRHLFEDTFISLSDSTTDQEGTLFKKLRDLNERYSSEIDTELGLRKIDNKDPKRVERWSIYLLKKPQKIAQNIITAWENSVAKQKEEYENSINDFINFIQKIKTDREFIKEITDINSQIKEISSQKTESKGTIKNFQNKYRNFLRENKMQEESFCFTSLLIEKFWLYYDKHVIKTSSEEDYKELQSKLPKLLKERLDKVKNNTISINSKYVDLKQNQDHEFVETEEPVKEKWKEVLGKIYEFGSNIQQEYSKLQTIGDIENLRASGQRKTFNGALGLSDMEIKEPDYFQSLPENTGLYQLMQELDRLKSIGDLEEEEYDNIKTSIEELIKKPQLFTLQNIFDNTVNTKLRDQNGNETKDKDGNVKLQDTSLSILKYVLIDLKERDMDTFNKLKKVVIEFTDYTIKEIKHPNFNHKKFAQFLTEIEIGLSYSNQQDGGRLVIHKVFDFFEKLEQNEKEIYLGSFIKAIKSIVFGGDNNNIHTLSDIVNILVQEHILKSTDKKDDEYQKIPPTSDIKGYDKYKEEYVKWKEKNDEIMKLEPEDKDSKEYIIWKENQEEIIKEKPKLEDRLKYVEAYYQWKEKQTKESKKDIEALHTFLNSEQREEIKGILNKIPGNYGIWKTISESLQTIISKHNKKSFEKRHKAVTAEISLNRVRIGGSSEKSQNGDTVKSIGYDKEAGEQGDNK